MSEAAKEAVRLARAESELTKALEGLEGDSFDVLKTIEPLNFSKEVKAELKRDYGLKDRSLFELNRACENFRAAARRFGKSSSLAVRKRVLKLIDFHARALELAVRALPTEEENQWADAVFQPEVINPSADPYLALSEFFTFQRDMMSGLNSWGEAARLRLAALAADKDGRAGEQPYALDFVKSIAHIVSKDGITLQSSDRDALITICERCFEHAGLRKTLVDAAIKAHVKGIRLA